MKATSQRSLISFGRFLLCLALGAVPLGCYDATDDEDTESGSSDDDSDSGTTTDVDVDEDTDTQTSTDIDTDGACLTAGDGCPFNESWPSACINSVSYGPPNCNNGQECIGQNLESAVMGMCGIPCELDNDTCPDTHWGLEGQCFTAGYFLAAPTTMCFVVGCENNYDCPMGMLCTGYANCPDLHPCEESGMDWDCTTIPECDNAPIEGKMCYPDNY